MAETWIAFTRLLELTEWSRRWALLQSAEGKIVSRQSKIRGLNGKPQREYLLSSLAPEAQLKHAQSAMAIVPAEPTTLALFPQGSEPAASSLSPGSLSQGPGRPQNRLALPPHLDAQAKQRYDAVEALLLWKKGNTITLRGGRTISNRNELAQYIAAQQQPAVSVRTVWRWYMAFKADGFNALADKTRCDKKKSRVFEANPTAALFIQQKYLSEGIQNVRLVYDALRREWPKLGIKGEAPSYPTVRSYLDNNCPLPVKTLAHEGKQALWAKRSPYIVREDPPPMECWIADHRVFDVLVRNTLFPHLAQDQQYRMWITAIYDWGSRVLVGHCFSANPCSDTINSALRMALSKYGFPRRFYWDNGKDFRAVKRKLDDIKEITIGTGLSSFMRQHEIAFDVTSALPFHPRSKPIEAYFSRWSKRFDVLCRKGYVGNRPGNCPEVARESQAAHKKYLAGKRADSPLAMDREFIVAADQWIHEFNEETPIDALGGKTPSEFLILQWADPGQRTKVPTRALDALLMKDDERIVQAGGAVEIQRMRYEPRTEFMGAMYLRQGRKVQILRDPFDLTVAVAVDPDNYEFVGELMLQIPVGMSPGDPQTMEQVKTRMRNGRALDRACRNYIDALAAGASGMGWKTEWQGLLDRAAQRTGTDNAALAAAPGSGRRELPAASVKLAPAFVSDAIQPGDAELFSSVEVDD